MNHVLHRLVSGSFLLLLICGGCQPSIDTTPAANGRLLLEKVKPADGTAPENLIQVTGRIYSGGEPNAAQHFRLLSELGVKTLISVDGAIPDIALAGQYGLRYIHIPIGYDGIDERCAATITKSVREIKGRIYVHCHHGKHRGPAAAAIAAIVDTDIAPSHAGKILELAGTSRDYAGLYFAVENFVAPIDLSQAGPLVEIAEVDNFIESMAAIGRANDHLQLCESSNWTSPANHPDLIPVNEATILWEGFQESLRQLEKTNAYAADMLPEIARSVALAKKLRIDLSAGDHESASDKIRLLRENCKSCHRVYRD